MSDLTPHFTVYGDGRIEQHVGFGQPVEMPWPDVPECYGTTLQSPNHLCAQCDGRHEHLWVTWRAVPPDHPIAYAGGVPTRCKACGGRKCDWTQCWERRHHRSPHVDIDGKILGPIGGAR